MIAAVAPLLAPLLARLRPAALRARDRDARAGVLLIALAAAVFSLWPQLDLGISAQFYDAERRGFIGNQWLAVRWLHEGVPWFGRLAAVVALLAALFGARSRGLLGLHWQRRTLMLGLVIAAGLGFAVNYALKENWGRARPAAVEPFGGAARFTPATVVTDQCRHNCSFVSGHASTGFMLMAVGALGSVATRRRWLAVGLAAGLACGLGRIAQGGHFASDVIFSCLVIWASTWVMRELWLRTFLLRRKRRLRRTGAMGMQPPLAV
jgi:membrane-associated PAP2 superfamily phosphatase